jgi:hypothetical protein
VVHPGPNVNVNDIRDDTISVNIGNSDNLQIELRNNDNMLHPNDMYFFVLKVDMSLLLKNRLINLHLVI